MSANSRFVLVDDRDSAIRYTGDWSAISGDAWNSRGEFGTTYLNTLRQTTASSASFSFTFNGDAARVMGTTSVRNAKTSPDPSWECYLDGVAQGKESYFDAVENNWAFCKFFDLSPTSHTIRVDIKSNGAPFLLDQIQYKPYSRVDNSVMMIHYTDPDLVYEGKWNEVTKTARYAPEYGGSMTFSFTGNRISVYGMYMHQLSHTDAPASYQIDNDPPVPFTIRGGGGSSAWNRLIFETGRLPQGRHTVKIINQGGTNMTPLVFGFARVEGGTTQLVGTASSGGGSGDGGGGGNPGSGGDSGGITTGGTQTTTAVAGSITVTKISDSDLDFDPGVDNVSDLVTKSMATTTRTAKNGDVTVIEIPASDMAGAPTDQGVGGSGNKSGGVTSATGKDTFPVAGIVGIVMGFLLILALVGMFLFWRRNRRRKAYQLPDNIQPHGFTGGYAPAGGAVSGYTDAPNAHPQAGSPDPGSYASGPAMANYGDNGSSLAASFATTTRAPLTPNRYTPSFDGSSSAASDFGAASSQSNLLQPVRKARDTYGNPVLPSEESHSSHGEGPSRLIVHEDSGLRLPATQRPLSQMDEIPPSYTPR